MSYSDKDKFGYYKVNDFKTYSKIEAIELAEQERKMPIWCFNELAFSSYNWKVEPTETLSQLYAKRAQQLREKYDYIVIFYSGGADSGNIVNSFVDNGIKFEELATYNYWSLDPRTDSFLHAEQVNVSYPRIKQLQEQGVDFKHRPIDLSDFAFEVFNDSFWNTHRAYYSNGHWGTTHLAKTFIRERVDDYKKIIEQGKKLVFVWGTDKPRVLLENGKYVFRFTDMVVDSGPGTRAQMLNRPWEHDELFYWSPDCIDLICKQGHVIKNFFKKHKDLDPSEFNKDNNVALPDILKMFDNEVTEDGLSYRNLMNWLIYPKFDIKMFSKGKPHSTVYSLRDQYWLKDHLFKQQVDKLAQHFNTLNVRWWRDPNNIEHGIKFLYSPPYYLE